MQKWLCFFLLAIFLVGCVPPGHAPELLSPTPTPTPTRPAGITPTAPPEIQKGLHLSLRVRGNSSYQPEIEAGAMLVLEQSFEPEIREITRKADGSIYSTRSPAWADAPVAQMRTCLAVDERGCTLGEWQPFQKLQTREITIDWLGLRSLRLLAEFRDANQAAIPALAEGYSASPPPGTVELGVVGVVRPNTALEKLPGPLLTAIAATRAAAPPVTGAVVIEDNRCCAGGTAGSSISLKVAFQASSPAGKVTEMRVSTGGGCQKNSPTLDAPWEPFQESKSYSTSLVINWVGWWINVQYRDAAGNLSAVDCDDISLEGSPARPSP